MMKEKKYDPHLRRQFSRESSIECVRKILQKNNHSKA